MRLTRRCMMRDWCRQVAAVRRGGKKASGFGRELGTYGLSSYQNIKQITTYVSKDRWDWYPSKL